MKRGLALETFGKILLGLLVVLVILFLLWVFSGPAQDVITYILDALRFGV